MIVERIQSLLLSCVFIIWVFSIFSNDVVGYDLYQEGYYNVEKRPGSDSDPRGMPNLPLYTDTNRYSDAVTSSSSFDPTSPHFPDYQGALANTTDRYIYLLEYQSNAAEQGIATFGEGDARREDAAFIVKNNTNIYHSKTFPVYAALKWNPSGFAIQEGVYYNISVLGDNKGFAPQFWQDGAIRVDGDGYSSYYDAISNCYIGLGRCRGYLKRKRRLPSANWMSLACSIGQFVRALRDIEPGKESDAYILPLDESTLQEAIFYVGRSTVFRASYTGELICFANDAHSNYWNNAGSLQVTATSLTPTQTSGFYYQDLYLPACDSAIAVYANGGQSSMDGMRCNPNGGGAGWPKQTTEVVYGVESIPTDVLYNK